MTEKLVSPRLADIVESIERLCGLLNEVSLDEFEKDWRRRWTVERGIEIISEASRHVSDETKLRHPEIPWRKVAGIGNVLRHDYGHAAPDILWKLVREDLPALYQVCRSELEAALKRER